MKSEKHWGGGGLKNIFFWALCNDPGGPLGHDWVAIGFLEISTNFPSSCPIVGVPPPKKTNSSQRIQPICSSLQMCISVGSYQSICPLNSVLRGCAPFLQPSFPIYFSFLCVVCQSIFPTCLFVLLNCAVVQTPRMNVHTVALGFSLLPLLFSQGSTSLGAPCSCNATPSTTTRACLGAF